jgi:hypothetical protein
LSGNRNWNAVIAEKVMLIKSEMINIPAIASLLLSLRRIVRSVNKFGISSFGRKYYRYQRQLGSQYCSGVMALTS